MRNENFKVSGSGTVEFREGERIVIRNGNGHAVERIEVGSLNTSATNRLRKEGIETNGVYNATRTKLL